MVTRKFHKSTAMKIFYRKRKVLIFVTDFLLQSGWRLSPVQRCSAYFQMQFNCSPDVFIAGQWNQTSHLHIQLAAKSYIYISVANDFFLGELSLLRVLRARAHREFAENSPRKKSFAKCCKSSCK